MAGRGGPLDRLKGVDRKTVRCYVQAAVAVEVNPDCGVEQLTDGLFGGSADLCVRCPGSHWAAWEALAPNEELIRGWILQDPRLTNIAVLLSRRRLAADPGERPKPARSSGRTVRLLEPVAARRVTCAGP
ncbi:MAG: hypothetical protein ACRDTD_28465 [Pseudonocardiaceae bacterium]